MTVQTGERNTTTTLRITPSLLKLVKKLAVEKGVKTSTLICYVLKAEIAREIGRATGRR